MKFCLILLKNILFIKIAFNKKYTRNLIFDIFKIIVRAKLDKNMKINISTNINTNSSQS